MGNSIKKAVQNNRDKAPDARVFTTHVDARTALTSKLQEKHKGFVYSFITKEQAKDIDYLEEKGLEIVGKDGLPVMEGRPCREHQDYLVRAATEIDSERKVLGHQASWQRVKGTLFNERNEAVKKNNLKEAAFKKKAKPKKPPLEEELGE
jgi:hypothetical protein